MYFFKESYQNIKDSLSTAITKNLLYTGGRYQLNDVQSDSESRHFRIIF